MGVVGMVGNRTTTVADLATFLTFKNTFVLIF